RRSRATDRGVDESIDGVDAQSIPRHARPVSRDRETWLSELLDEGHMIDAGNALDDPFDCAAFLFEDGEVRAEHLHVEGRLETRERLVDRILGRLRVVEGDAGKDGELSLDGFDQFVLRVKYAIPFTVRLQPYIEFGIKE